MHGFVVRVGAAKVFDDFPAHALALLARKYAGSSVHVAGVVLSRTSDTVSRCVVLVPAAAASAAGSGPTLGTPSGGAR